MDIPTNYKGFISDNVENKPTKEPKEIEEVGDSVHKILNETLFRKLTIKEYKELIELLSPLFRQKQSIDKECKSISIFKERISSCCNAPVIIQDFEDGNCLIWCGECGKTCGFRKVEQLLKD